MGQPAPERESAATRKARVAVVGAKAKGEKVPSGVKLIGFRPISGAAQAHAATLVPAARQAMPRRPQTATA